MARSITVPRVHRMVCNAYNNPDIKDGNTPRQNRAKAGLAICSAEYNYFDPILDMDEGPEFVSPSHPEQNGLTDHKNNRHQ